MPQRKILLLFRLVLILFLITSMSHVVGAQRSRPLIPACGYQPAVALLLERASLSQWLDWAQDLTGVEPAPLASGITWIRNRHSIAMFTGDPQARAFDYVKEQLQNLGYAVHEEHSYPYQAYLFQNLIVELPGEDPNPQIVVLSAHLDDWGRSDEYRPGADDNAIGAAALLEAARLLRQFRFRHTLRLIWFSGEELGLLGSKAYVESHPGSYTGAINLDMFGYDGDGDRCFDISAGTMPASQEIGQCVATQIDVYGLDIQSGLITTGATYRSDHASFWGKGIAAVQIGENADNDSIAGSCSGRDFNPYYHGPGDTLAIVSTSYAFDIARASITAAADLALPVSACFKMAPSIQGEWKDGQFHLEWEPVDGAAQYRVLRSHEGCGGSIESVGSTPSPAWTDEWAPVGASYQVEAVSTSGCASPPSACLRSGRQVFFPAIGLDAGF